MRDNGDPQYINCQVMTDGTIEAMAYNLAIGDVIQLAEQVQAHNARMRALRRIERGAQEIGSPFAEEPVLATEIE